MRWLACALLGTLAVAVACCGALSYVAGAIPFWVQWPPSGQWSQDYATPENALFALADHGVVYALFYAEPGAFPIAVGTVDWGWKHLLKVESTPNHFIAIGTSPWLLAVLLGAYPARCILLPVLRRRRGVCVECRYSLTGNVSGRCPECGTPCIRARQPGERRRALKRFAAAILGAATMVLAAATVLSYFADVTMLLADWPRSAGRWAAASPDEEPWRVVFAGTQFEGGVAAASFCTFMDDPTSNPWRRPFLPPFGRGEGWGWRHLLRVDCGSTRWTYGTVETSGWIVVMLVGAYPVGHLLLPAWRRRRGIRGERADSSGRQP